MIRLAQRQANAAIQGVRAKLGREAPAAWVKSLPIEDKDLVEVTRRQGRTAELAVWGHAFREMNGRRPALLSRLDGWGVVTAPRRATDSAPGYRVADRSGS